jgi:putative membrane protein (TIGR04086 family)
MYEEKIKKENTLVKTILISSALGAIATVALMLIFAMVIVLLQLDRAYSAPLATVSIAIGSMLSSYYCGRKVSKNGYLIGLANGAAVFALILLISLIVSDWSFSLNTIFHLIIILTASTAGGIFGVNKKSSKKYI